MNNKKSNQSNILIIAAVIFVIIAVIFFVIALSMFGDQGGFGNENSAASSDAVSSYESSSGKSSSSAPSSSSQSSSKPVQSSSQRPQSSSASTDLTLAQKIVENARQYIGTPFKDGGAEPEGFDSSGFIYYIMRESGFVSCPRDIVLQSKMGVIREFDELQEGDIVFFSNEIGGKPNFAGFYSGNGKMIGCIITSSFEGVMETDITGNYYKQHFVSGIGIG